MLIDTHCHLTDSKFEGQLDGILERAREAGVEKIIVPTTGVLDARRAMELAGRYESVWMMAGVHPETLADETWPENREEWLASEGDWMGKLEEIIKTHGKIVGVGEIGLDFHYDKEKRSKRLQMEILEEELSLAVRHNLPVALHMRDAEEEMTELLTRTGGLPKGQIHCFGGSEKFLDFVLDKRLYVSFCGNITYPSTGSGRLRELIKKVPLDRLLLETDAPLLPPESKRGSINEPANVKILAVYIADLLKIPPETLINQTTHNSLCLFFGG